MSKGQVLKVVFLSALIYCVAVPVFSFEFTVVPDGYYPYSVDIGAPATGALVSGEIVSGDPHIIYVGAGEWGVQQYVVKVDIAARTREIVCDNYDGTAFGSIGGLALLETGELIITENYTFGTIFIARDNNEDGDWNDEGEVTELIEPVLADSGFGFTGSKTRVVPDGGSLGIPGGSVIVQTADGDGSGDLLAVTDVTTSPTFKPAGDRFYGGFDYDGGFDFVTSGTWVVMGTSTASFSGEVYALVNTDEDEDIDPGESNLIVDSSQLPFGISDLVVGINDWAYCTSSGSVYKIEIPAAPLSTTATAELFAETDSYYLNGIIINSTATDFAPEGPENKIIISSWGDTNLLILSPSQMASSVGDWPRY